MAALNTKTSDVLADVVSRVIAVGASEFEVEYKDGEERVFAVSGLVGVGIAAFRSQTEKAKALRKQLYELRRKRKKITLSGTEYQLRVEIFDSFGEDAFRVMITRS
ncbi:MAG TPA: hypothetical protein VFU31_26095 [Candidatus Binatia bacterium]|nr:hypothetical protein [Candidatus Binatia bacterium]